MQKSQKPTVLVLDRTRRVVTREPQVSPPAAPPPKATAAKSSTKAKVVERLKRFHPMD